MPQDAFTLKYLCAELNSLLVGGRINRIVAPNNDRVVFTIWTGKNTVKLLLDVNPAMPRIGVIDKDENAPLTASNFCMLLRKHLLNSRIESIELVGFDRVVKITFSVQDEFSNGEEKVVFVELMGRYSNVILTQNGKILGGNRGINMFDDGVRPLIVSRPYVLPPVNNKLLPNCSETKDYFANFSGGDFVQYITSGIQGLAQATAREIVSLFNNEFGEYTSKKSQEFYNFFKEFLFDSKVAPCVILDQDEIKDVCALDYTTILGERKYFDQLYQAEEFYFSQKEKLKKFKQKYERLSSVVSNAKKKVKKRLNAILAKEKDALDAEENKIKGELLLAYAYMIKAGEKSCEVLNYYDNTNVVIALDENLSIAKNAEKYFKKYTKQKRTLTALLPQKQTAESELEYLSSVQDFIGLSESYFDLVNIENELTETGYLRKDNQIKPKQESLQFRTYIIDNFTVKVGKNNKENDNLLYQANADDIWFHVKDYHSSHAILFTGGKQPSDDTLNKVSEIVAYYSKARGAGKCEVVHTKRKFVKKPSRSKPGFVTYTDFKTLMVKPNGNCELLKKQ